MSWWRWLSFAARVPERRRNWGRRMGGRQRRFLAGAGAGPVYRLLGKKDMGTTVFPRHRDSVDRRRLAFRQHSGGHTDVPNWPTFLTFASRYVKTPVVKASR